ncbi:MAG: LVIVD repeat-containing protein [Solirubrobacteraceae bacterium]
MHRLALAAAAVLLVLPAPSFAVEKTGVGEAIRHLQNIPHTEQANPAQTQQATDFELAAIDGRTYAFAGSYYDGLDIIDVTDPEHATKVASYDCGVGQGDVQVFRRDGRVLVAYAQDDGYDQFASDCVDEAKALGFDPSAQYGGTYIVDVTDPLAPHLVTFLAIDAGTNALGMGLGSHNTTVHPSGRYIYNSNADLITDLTPSIEIVDIGDLEHPKVVGEFALQTVPGLGTDAHDITFSPDGSRAYVAALSHGEILDTSDPAHPERVSTIVDPTLNVWHQMEELTVDDPLLGERSFLIAEDEFAGAEGTGECPSGAVHVYDITDEAVALPVGVFQIDQVGLAPGTVAADAYVARCTAHVFQIDRQAKIMTMGWYNAGVRVLDLSGLSGVAVGRTGVGIRQLGWYRFTDSDTWAAKAVRASRGGFYLFGNDKRRGFDVYRYDPRPGTAVSAGRWLTPVQARALLGRSSRGVSLSGLCFLAASV